MVWEAIFLLVILKIPIIYLGWVVWYAIKAKPEPPAEPVRKIVHAPLGLDPRPDWRPRLPGPRNGPHGAPRRTYARRASAFARADFRR